VQGRPENEHEVEHAPIFWFPDNVDAEKIVRGLAGANGDEYRRLALVRGVDAYAWYASFHQRAYQWGIYLPITGIAAFADAALRDTRIGWAQKLTFALRVALAHERFHFAADVALASVEATAGRPIWWRVREAGEPLEWLRASEEKIATAIGLRAIRHCRLEGATEAFRDFVAHSKTLPEGYCDAYQLREARRRIEANSLGHLEGAWEIALAERMPKGVEFQHFYPRRFQDRSATHELLN
jgi:hypothetical protein